MNSNYSRVLSILLAGLAGFIGGLSAWAEEPTVETPTVGSATTEAVRLSIVDRRMATYLMIDHQAEVDLAEFAAAHGQAQAVKRYAHDVAQDYAAFAKHWDEKTGGQFTAIARRISTTGDASADGALGENQPRSAFPLVNMERTLLNIKVEVTAQCAHAVRAELETIAPAEFDSTYLGSQIHRQIQNAATLKVLQRYATPRMVPILEDAAKLAQHHLDNARSLLATMTGEHHVVSNTQTSAVVGPPQGASTHANP
jgi:predicted outer membrane protein